MCLRGICLAAARICMLQHVFSAELMRMLLVFFGRTWITRHSADLRDIKAYSSSFALPTYHDQFVNIRDSKGSMTTDQGAHRQLWLLLGCAKQNERMTLNLGGWKDCCI